jgi:hypothetical protein
MEASNAPWLDGVPEQMPPECLMRDWAVKLAKADLTWQMSPDDQAPLQSRRPPSTKIGRSIKSLSAIIGITDYFAGERIGPVFVHAATAPAGLSPD